MQNKYNEDNTNSLSERDIESPQKRRKVVLQFRVECMKEWPALKASSSGTAYAYCTLCKQNFKLESDIY